MRTLIVPEPIATALRRWVAENCRKGSVAIEIADEASSEFSFSSDSTMRLAETFIDGFVAATDIATGRGTHDPRRLVRHAGPARGHEDDDDEYVS